jgi:hypothetical protein
MPEAYGVEAMRLSGVRASKMRIPSPMAIGFTNRCSSSMRRCSISDDTNVAPP